MANKPQPKDECFIVGAIGNPGSEHRIHADWFIDAIVDPVFSEHFPDFEVTRSDRMKTPGMITSQIIEKLLDARLVIADMTFLNANAFYEIGIRHMAAKPIIHAHRDGDPIPFDVSPFASMPFSTGEYQHILDARELLLDTVKNVLAKDYVVENPVTQTRGKAQFDQVATPPDKLLLVEIEKINDRLAFLERGRIKTRSSTPFFLHSTALRAGPAPRNLAFLASSEDAFDILRSTFEERIVPQLDRDNLVEINASERSIKMLITEEGLPDWLRNEIDHLSNYKGIVVTWE